MEIRIGKRIIGSGHPVFIVAEISGNHNKSYTRTKKLIDAAIAAGVDAVKLQTYTPDTLTIKSANKWFKVKKGNEWSGRFLYDLYKEAYMPWEFQPRLAAYAKKRGLFLFSTPFDGTAVNFLEKMRTPLYKVASFEIGDLELLKRIGQTKKPVILSRGMATVEEIKLALRILRANGSRQIAILHCVSSYPAKAVDMNLATIPDLAKRFKVVTGLSDHTLTNTAALAAVALGASIIEKHLTLKRSDGGVDSEFSLEPGELASLIHSIREVEKSLGRPTYEPIKTEAQSLAVKRSLFVVADIKQGEKFTKHNVRSIRPGYGLPPKFLSKVIGAAARVDIERGTPLSFDLLLD